MEASFPVLYSDRLILRSLEPTDKFRYFDIFSSPTITKYYGCPILKNLSEVDEHFERFKNLFNEGRLINWAIILREKEKYVGNIELFGINRQHHKAVVGCAIDNQYWRNKIGYEATLLVMKFFFKNLQYNRLEVYIDVNNAPAIHNISNLGFYKEGMLRESEFENEHFVNIYLFSMLKKEYEFLYS